MGAMASQINSLTIVYPAVYSGADQRKQQSYASLAFVWGIHRWPVNSTHKGPVTRECFHLMTSSWLVIIIRKGVPLTQCLKLTTSTEIYPKCIECWAEMFRTMFQYVFMTEGFHCRCTFAVLKKHVQYIASVHFYHNFEKTFWHWIKENLRNYTPHINILHFYTINRPIDMYKKLGSPCMVVC